jgi:hypothetical protein
MIMLPHYFIPIFFISFPSFQLDTPKAQASQQV